MKGTTHLWDLKEGFIYLENEDSNQNHLDELRTAFLTSLKNFHFTTLKSASKPVSSTKNQ